MNRVQSRGGQAASESARLERSAREGFARLFVPGACAVQGCDRRRAQGSRFCGSCQADRRAGRQVVWHGGKLLPDGKEMERRMARGPQEHISDFELRNELLQ